MHELGCVACWHFGHLNPRVTNLDTRRAVFGTEDLDRIAATPWVFRRNVTGESGRS